MIQALRRRLLDRFVLRPSRHEIGFGSKDRRCATHGDMVDEYFVQFYRAGDPEFGHGDTDPEVDLLVLKFPGTAGRAERATEWPCGLLPNVSAKIVTWNAPGYGGSSGRPSLTAIPPRADRFARSVLQQMPKPPKTIWLVGNSLGCATAAHLASQSDLNVDGVLLRNPPPLIETVQRVASRYPLGKLTFPVAESLVPQMNLLLTAGKITAPTVIFQSELDELVPPESQNKVFDRLNVEKRLFVLKGLLHGSIATEEHEPAFAQAVEWLWSKRQV